MFTCTVGLLSGFGTWDGLSVHDPHIHDPGIQYEPEAYEAFFTQLVAGVQSTVQRKSDEMRQIEQERAALQEVAQAQHDTVLEQWTRQSATYLAQSVRLLGQAALLLLKKVALCQ